jgi:hypothetical protein
MDPYLAIRLQVLAVSIIGICLGIAVIACFFRWIERKNGYKIGFLLFISLLFLMCIFGFIYLMAYRAEVVIVNNTDHTLTNVELRLSDVTSAVGDILPQSSVVAGIVAFREDELKMVGQINGTEIEATICGYTSTLIEREHFTAIVRPNLTVDVFSKGYLSDTYRAYMEANNFSE